MSEDIVFGLHAVQSLMERQLDQVREIQVQRGRKGGRIEDVIEQAKAAGIDVRFVDKARLDRQADGVHQGILARVSAANSASGR